MLGDLTLAAASRALQLRQVTSAELTAQALYHIQTTNPVVNSWVTVLAEAATAAARQADREIARGGVRGPLHGIPLGIKDNIDIRGVRTTAGSRVRAHHVAGADAPVTRRLREAGAVFLGTLNMHEFGQGVTSENPHHGPVRNPWDPSRIAGGSSGGSAAAVAARTCLGALGTDTGGSVRLPAGLTGVTGLRPTYGRVSTEGIVTLAWSLDSCGPIARTAEDVSMMLAMMSETPYNHWESGEVPDLHTVTLGVSDFDSKVDDDVRHVITAAIDDLASFGARIIPVRLPDQSVAQSVLMVVNFAEPPAYHRQWSTEHSELYGADVRATLLAGQSLAAWEYVLAQRARTHLTRTLLDALYGVDALLMPTSAFAAPLLSSATGKSESAGRSLDATALIDGAVRFNAYASVASTPALSIPCGFTARGLPVGLQLVGRPWDESVILRIAHAYQMRTPWHTRVPNVLT